MIYTLQVTKLCDLQTEQDLIMSVSWTEKGNYLGIGTQNGLVQVWDVANSKKVLSLPGHTSRVGMSFSIRICRSKPMIDLLDSFANGFLAGCLAWNGDLVCSGGRDRVILQRDIRSPPLFPERKLTHHKQEVGPYFG